MSNPKNPNKIIITIPKINLKGVDKNGNKKDNKNVNEKDNKNTNEKDNKNTNEKDNKNANEKDNKKNNKNKKPIKKPINLICTNCNLIIDDISTHKIYEDTVLCEYCYYIINGEYEEDEEQEDEEDEADVDNEDQEDEEDDANNEDKSNKRIKNDNINCCNDNNKTNYISSNFDEFFSSIINKLEMDKNNLFIKRQIIKEIDKNEKNEKDDIDESKLEYEWLGPDIKNIDDLIRLGNTYNSKKRKRNNLNLNSLNKLVEPLTELKNMVGMTDVKKIIFDQIIYYLQRLDDKNVDMLHTVIVGPPGVGKTQLTHIIAKIYNKLGFLKTDKVICAKRDDLVAEYVGQTAPKTRKVLEKALGGVLLLDEVYSLSPTSEKDFAKEAIDMINMYLSEHSHDLVCVIAGYKKPTYENFLSQNEGLSRRFTHHFEIKGYTPEELALIYKKYVFEQKWELLESIEKITPIIEKHMKLFPNFGGDMTTLFSCCKKTHSKRLLLIPTENELRDTKKKLTILDIEEGIKLFTDIKEKSKDVEDDKGMYMNMYT